MSAALYEHQWVESAECRSGCGSIFEKILLGENPLEIEQRVKEMDAVICNNGIKEHFDLLALYDVASQHAGCALWSIFGSKRTKLFYGLYCQCGDATKNGGCLLIIKEKVSCYQSKIRQRRQRCRRWKLFAIRLAWNPNTYWCNQGWDKDEAITTLKTLQPYIIQHCEEPISQHDFNTAARNKTTFHFSIWVIKLRPWCKKAS